MSENGADVSWHDVGKVLEEEIRERINIDELKNVVYQRVKELHVQKYPYNDFLYQTYEEEE